MELISDVNRSFSTIRYAIYMEVLEAFWKGTEVGGSRLKGVRTKLELMRVNGSFCGRRWKIP